MLSHFFDLERLIHSLKTATACMLGFVAVKLIDLPADQWIVITILVVMCAQLYVGSVLQKAYLRFLGTCFGCLFASVVILAFGTNSFTIAIMLGIASFLFSYIATSQENLSYMGSLGAVTTAIILLGQEPTQLIVVERFIEISIGIMIATVVSQFFIPINARTHLRREQAATLNQLREFYIATMTKHHAEAESHYEELDEAIVKSILRQRQLAKEAAREPLGEKFSAKHFMQTLFAERELIRAMSFMHNAYQHINPAEKLINVLPSVYAFHTAVENALTILVRVIEANHPSPEHIHMPDTAPIKQALEPTIQQSDREQAIYIDGYLVAMDLLAQSVGKIARLYEVEIKS